MARIELTDMRFYANHGCFEQEREIGTHFRVDLMIQADTRLAEGTDEIADTVNYLSVYQLVQREMEKPSNLLENVARRICDTVMGAFGGIKRVKVKVSKLNPPLGGQLGAVSVEVSSTRKGRVGDEH